MERKFPKEMHELSLLHVLARYSEDKSCSGFVTIECGINLLCDECILRHSHGYSKDAFLVLLVKHKLFDEGEVLAARFDG